MNTEPYETIVIGGGQAGLSIGYHLAKRNGQFVVLDENERVGDAWRKRWDSLRLFTPARFNGLPGMPFEAPRWSFPTKDEMADYLEAYADRFALPVRTGVKVERVVQEDGRLVVSLGEWTGRWLIGLGVAVGGGVLGYALAVSETSGALSDAVISLGLAAIMYAVLRYLVARVRG